MATQKSDNKRQVIEKLGQNTANWKYSILRDYQSQIAFKIKLITDTVTCSPYLKGLTKEERVSILKAKEEHRWTHLLSYAKLSDSLSHSVWNFIFEVPKGCKELHGEMKASFFGIAKKEIMKNFRALNECTESEFGEYCMALMYHIPIKLDNHTREEYEKNIAMLQQMLQARDKEIKDLQEENKQNVELNQKLQKDIERLKQKVPKAKEIPGKTACSSETIDSTHVSHFTREVETISKMKISESVEEKSSKLLTQMISAQHELEEERKRNESLRAELESKMIEHKRDIEHLKSQITSEREEHREALQRERKEFEAKTQKEREDFQEKMKKMCDMYEARLDIPK